MQGKGFPGPLWAGKLSLRRHSSSAKIQPQKGTYFMPGDQTTTPLLKIASIETLYFDRIYALHGLSLQVKEKEIFAVLGPNGAGKTTLLKTIAGLLKDQPKKGTIEFAGRRIHRVAPERIASLGHSVRAGRQGPVPRADREGKLGTGLLGPEGQCHSG